LQAALAALQQALAHDAAGRRDYAAAAFQRLLSLVPEHPGARLRLAQFAVAEGRTDAAREHLQRAIAGARAMAIGHEAAPIFAELAVLERRAGRHDASLAAARLGLHHCGEIAGLIWEECEALRALADAPQRLRRLNRLALLQPDDPVILVELGLALLDTPSAQQAIAPLRRAIELGHRDSAVAITLATLELHAGEANAAVARLERLQHDTQGPTLVGVLGVLWFARKQQCDWQRADALELRWSTLLEAGQAHSALTPFMLLASRLPPDRLRQYTARYNAAFGARASTPALPTAPGRARHARLRIGYVSADFHAHATAILCAGLFEQHSRERVELYAYSYGPRVDDDYRRRLKAAIPHWRDINDLTDAQAADLIVADALDVLVELKGLTYGARPGIAALRPAPRIVHYLGYPGTLCSAGIDYLVGDDIVTPASDAAFYGETVLRLPRCYQVNDSERARPAVATRAELGLPDDAIVLCNFNQSFKWSAEYFDVWFAALRAQPRALLWLLEPGPDARHAVTARAQAAGVGGRLHWAQRLPADAHLARLGTADLALDQLPVASHTTAADALWMGVPLLTCLGAGFHGRVGASLLSAVGLDDFVAHDLADYGRRLQALLADRVQLAGARQRLARSAAAALFDTDGFARDWENLLLALCPEYGAAV